MEISFKTKCIFLTLKLAKVKNLYKINNEKKFFKRIKILKSLTNIKIPKYDKNKLKLEKIKDDFGLELFKNKNSKNRIIVFYNGGAWMLPFSNLHYKLLFNLIDIYESDALIVKYPLIPEFNGDDIRKRFKDIAYQINKIIKDKEVIFAGDSAGGHCALYQAILHKNLNYKTPDKILFFSPCLYSYIDENLYEKYKKTDLMLDPSPHILIEKFKGSLKDIKDKEINLGENDLSFIKNIEYYIGDRDVLCAQAEYFYEEWQDKISIKLNIYKGLFHDFALMNIKETKLMLEHINETKNDFSKTKSKKTYF